MANGEIYCGVGSECIRLLQVNHWSVTPRVFDHHLHRPRHFGHMHQHYGRMDTYEAHDHTSGMCFARCVAMDCSRHPLGLYNLYSNSFEKRVVRFVRGI